ncbi:MAG: efflux RND transporter periplasmic adaptor subunit [Geovibrio sp.]|nr:efflux RND transporter periplasmic adaptor subunit [Geovibrio sp.]MCD8568196.1 efflux RND transporter periplasmic adaptor subunit [Geovibrio sp.]
MARRYLNKTLFPFAAAAFLLAPAAYADDFSMFEDAPSIQLTGELIQKLGVKPAKAEYRESVKKLKLPGIVQADETSSFSVNSKFGGWIEKLYVDYRGRNVKKGERVAEIYSPEAVAAQEEYLAFLKYSANISPSSGGAYGSVFAEDAKRLTESARQRLKYWDITEKQIQEIEKTGRSKRTITLYSPASGYVTAKNVSEGMKTEPGMELFSAVSLANLWIIADIYEEELKHIRVGSKANVTLAGIPNVIYELTADYIYPEVSQRTRTLKVRFLVNNRSGLLKPSMYTEILAEFPAGRVLAVPSDAVIDDGRRKIVFVSLGEGRFEPREILTGAQTDGFTEVRKGLSEGETVARGANFLLDSEAQLKGISPVKGF